MGGNPNPKGVKVEYENVKFLATEDTNTITLRIFPEDGGSAKVYHFNMKTGDALDE